MVSKRSGLEPSQARLEDVRQDCEAFLGELSREYYLHGAGLKEDLESEAIYKRYDGLFHRETVGAVGVHLGRASLSSSPADLLEARRLRILWGFLTQGHMAVGVNHFHDQMAAQMSRATIELDGQTIPFRQAGTRMINEPDRGRRDDIEERVREVRRTFLPLNEARMQRLHEMPLELGYEHYTALFTATKRVDYLRLRGLTDRFLTETDDLYFGTLRPALESMGVPPESAHRHDGAFLFRATAFDNYFSKEHVVPVLRRTLLGMGIDLEAQRNIVLDIEARPQKSPRAFCSMVRVPQEVYLVITPIGGQMDYAAILHEAGHAQHFGNTSAAEPFEFRLLGDLSVSETYAFLFNHLPMDPEWLSVYLGMEDSAAWMRTVYLEKLHIVRRYAAKLRYELALHTQGLPNMPQVYTQTLSAATGFAYNEVDYLSDIDDGFYTAEYLRAWVLDAMLRKRLREQFGMRWFLNPEAGAFLKGLWSTGQKFDAEETARQIGYPEGLDPSYLIEEFQHALTRSAPGS